MRAKTPQAFKARRDIERYFSGDTIECLICGRHFKRLQTHLAAKHDMAADEYKKRFGLPWTRGLTSATSLANSGWTDERKAKARKLARKSRIFKLAHLTPRRELAPFLKAEAVEHLGINATAFGEKFDEERTANPPIDLVPRRLIQKYDRGSATRTWRVGRPRRRAYARAIFPPGTDYSQRPRAARAIRRLVAVSVLRAARKPDDKPIEETG
jgi:hypothetical protein